MIYGYCRISTNHQQLCNQRHEIQTFADKNRRYLIEKNSHDSKLYDGDMVTWWFTNNFEYAGTFRYVNVMGSVSTIRKIRRVK